MQWLACRSHIPVIFRSSPVQGREFPPSPGSHCRGWGQIELTHVGTHTLSHESANTNTGGLASVHIKPAKHLHSKSRLSLTLAIILDSQKQLNGNIVFWLYKYTSSQFLGHTFREQSWVRIFFHLWMLYSTVSRDNLLSGYCEPYEVCNIKLYMPGKRRSENTSEQQQLEN